jgi:hypothetical protein
MIFIGVVIMAVAAQSSHRDTAIIGVWIALLWGVTQWILVLPLIVYLRKRGKRETVKGILILSFIGLLFTSICGGLMLMPMIESFSVPRPHF